MHHNAAQQPNNHDGRIYIAHNQQAATALRDALASGLWQHRGQVIGGSMQVQTIVYVTNMERSIEWYSTLLNTAPTQTSEHWTTFAVGGAVVALHASDQVVPPGNVALSLVVDEQLEDAAARISPDAVIDDQPFGRSFIATDPDGAVIQVNEHA